MKYTDELIQKLTPGLMYDPNLNRIILVGNDRWVKVGDYTGFVRMGREYRRGQDWRY